MIEGRRLEPEEGAQWQRLTYKEGRVVRVEVFDQGSEASKRLDACVELVTPPYKPLLSDEQVQRVWVDRRMGVLSGGREVGAATLEAVADELDAAGQGVAATICRARARQEREYARGER